MKQIIRWGILGTGKIAKQFSEGLSYLDDAQIYAVGSRSQDKADSFARQFNAVHSYGSFEELVSDVDVDVVYVATPHHVHRDHCIMALEAGKPILCEKPFAINVAQAREVISMARDRGLFCMEAMWMRFIPAITHLMTQLEEGAIGEPNLLSANFGVPFRFNPEGRQFDLESAGGALLDLGIYPISLAQQLFGPTVEIATVAIVGDSGVDETSSIILKHATGQMSTIQTSVRYEMPTDAIVTGSKGTIRIHSPIYRPHKISIETFSLIDPEISETASPSKLRSLIKQIPLLQKIVLHLESYLTPVSNALGTTVIPFVGNGYNYEAAVVNQCLKEGKMESELMSLDDTLGVLSVLDAIREQWGLRYPGE